jgi:hypothetical protein
LLTIAILTALLSQDIAPESKTNPTPDAAAKLFKLESGTKVPMSLLNSVSTKHAAEGDRVYLETIFPVMANGRIVIPPGSSVAGTLTRVKRPGRVKGKGELFLRFDQLILPNGVVRDFRSRLGGMDGRSSEGFDRNEGKVSSDTNKTGEVVAVGTAASTGAALGGWIGQGAGGAGLGAAAGAGAALVGILLSRGPDAILAKGTTLEMVLDREIAFAENEVDFSRAVPARLSSGDSPGTRTRSRF